MTCTSQPSRLALISELRGRLGHLLATSVGIRLHAGKTQVWNAGGIEPSGVRDLGADVWRGDPARPAAERGLRVLGLPVGTPQYEAV